MLIVLHSSKLTYHRVLLLVLEAPLGSLDSPVLLLLALVVVEEVLLEVLLPASLVVSLAAHLLDSVLLPLVSIPAVLLLASTPLDDDRIFEALDGLEYFTRRVANDTFATY